MSLSWGLAPTMIIEGRKDSLGRLIRKQFYFGSVKIDKPFLARVNNRCRSFLNQLSIIGPLRLPVKTGINVFCHSHRYRVEN